MEDLSTQITKAISGYNAAAEAGKAESAYYFTLALEKLEQLQQKRPASGALTLLSPTSAIHGTKGIYGYGYYDTNRSYARVFGAHYWHVCSTIGVQQGSNDPWVALHYPEYHEKDLITKCTLHKYTITMHSSAPDGFPAGWQILVSSNSRNGIDGDWQVIDEITGLTPSVSQSFTREIQTKVAGNWIKYLSLGAYDTHKVSGITRNSLSSISYMGVEN